jgi:hypothetical protein
MKRNAIAVLAAAAALGLPVAQAQAQSQPNTPQAKAEAAARQGPEQLRRFIQRTRMIYGLYFQDFYKQ